MAYAIFRANGQQFKAEPGRTVRLPYIESAEPGSTLTFDEVLLTSDGTTVKAGAPTVEGAKVVAEVVGPAQGEKLYVFRFKRRKNYRRKTGHRQKYTDVMITDLTV